MDGILVVDKPAGLTSARVVDRVRDALGARDVGHCGTLDPAATGVLVMVAGQARKLQQILAGRAKAYEAEVTLGCRSDTLDSEGPLHPVEPPPSPRPHAALEAALVPFRGEILQVPPAHSAIRVGGKRAWSLARRGEMVELPPRRVVLHELTLLEQEWPRLRLLVRCSSGTYIRSLARDLGEALGTGAYLSALCRTEASGFRLDEARPPDEITRAHLRPLAAALREEARVDLGEEAREPLLCGKEIDPPGDLPEGDPLVAWIADEPVALLRRHGDRIRTLRWLGPAR